MEKRAKSNKFLLKLGGIAVLITATIIIIKQILSKTYYNGYRI